MRKFIVGLVVGILVVPFGFYMYLRSGNAPVATSAPPLPLERFLVKTAMHATIDRHETPVHLTNVSNDSLTDGAKIYLQDCAVCHGIPDQARTAVAAGMFPRPPQFFRPHAEKIDDPASEVYWKVKNGIRLTGMPGFERSLNEGQLLDLTGFIEDATTLPPSVLAVLKGSAEKTPEPHAPKLAPAAAKHKGT